LLRGRTVRGSGHLFFGVALAVIGVAAGLLGLNAQTYARLAHEAPVAQVSVRSLDPATARYLVTLRRLDGTNRSQTFELQADEWVLIGRDAGRPIHALGHAHARSAPDRLSPDDQLAAGRRSGPAATRIRERAGASQGRLKPVALRGAGLGPAWIEVNDIRSGEIFEFLAAQVARSASEPKMNIFG
jgi:hypothetical protein